MAAHRRPLVTSAVAGGLLCALWFVPTANASYETDPEVTPPPKSVSTTETETETGAGAGTETGAGTQLADTGSFEATPYVTGGIAFLAAGAGLLAHSVRRAREAE